MPAGFDELRGRVREKVKAMVMKEITDRDAHWTLYIHMGRSQPDVAAIVAVVVMANVPARV